MTLLVDDRELLAGFRDGQREALDRIYRYYAPRITRFLRNGFMYTSSGQPTSFPGIVAPFELEGAVQEVFARALTARARASYDGLRPYEGFLVGIARNVVLDRLRKQARRGERIEMPEVIEQRAVAAGATAAPPAPEQSLDERRGRDLVQAFLAAECKGRDLELYRLRYEDELSQVATAEAAGLTRIQIRRWEAGFRGRLLRYLKRQRYDRGPTP